MNAVPPRATAAVVIRDGVWVGQHHAPGRTPVRVTLGATAGMDLGQACGRWARALRRRGWLPVGEWATAVNQRSASVPLRRLADLLHQQLLLVPSCGDRPRLVAMPLRRQPGP